MSKKFQPPKLSAQKVQDIRLELLKGHPRRIERLEIEIAAAVTDGESDDYIAHFTQKRDAYQKEYAAAKEAGLL